MNTNPIIKIPVTELKTALLGLGKVLHRASTLPVLTTICVESDRQGITHLTSTDLDAFVTLRLEKPGSLGTPTKFLVPFVDIQKLSKTCPLDQTLELEPVANDKVLIRYHLNNHPVEQVFTVPPAVDFPELPPITASPFSLEEAAKSTLLDTLACASDDETRVILNGAYLDVSKPGGHYAVATDGRHLYASNSLHLPLAASVLIPDHRFLSWGGFVRDGQWKLSVQPPTKDKGGYIQMESRRWTFLTKQIEGTYPNWRNITEDVQNISGTLKISAAAAEAIQSIIPRLPGEDQPNHTMGLQVQQGKLFLRGWNQGQEQPTEIEVPDVTVEGTPAMVHLNRKYLLKAIGFGLHQIDVQEALKPLRFSDGSSRQMIVMPVRVDGFTNAPAGINTPPSTPAAIQPEPSTNNQQPTEERNTHPMQNGTNNGNGHSTAATSETNPADKVSVEQALDQVESIKTSLRGAVINLNGLIDTLRQVQRERRVSEREVRNVRDTLKTLQTVRL